MMLTATRPGEARGASWKEFDLDASSWTIPAARMKGRKIHSIPLAKQTVLMLRELHQLTGDGEYLFPAKRGAAAATVSDMAILKAVRRTAGPRQEGSNGCELCQSNVLRSPGEAGPVVRRSARRREAWWPGYPVAARGCVGRK